MKIRFGLCLLGATLLAGCGNGEQGFTPVPAPITSATRSVDTFDISTTVPKNNFARGEEIPITFNVVNNGKRDVILRQGSPARMFYVIRQGDKRIAFGNYITAGVLTAYPFNRNERYTDNAVWEQRTNPGDPVPSGTYTIQVYIPATVEEGNTVLPLNAETDLISNPIDILIR